MRKKLISILLALSAALCVPALAAPGSAFSDVPAGEWYAPYVEQANSLGLVTGTGGGKFSPGEDVSYAQFAAMLTAISYAEERDAAEPVPGAPWWEPACVTAAAHGLFAGTPMAQEQDWSRYANAPVPRGDMAMMAYSYLLSIGQPDLSDSEAASVQAQISDAGGLDEAHAKAVAYCYRSGVVGGVGGGRFAPDQTMSRAQAATVLCGVYRAASGAQESPHPDGAVGGRYDTALYTVPADTNRDGWITAAEVQAVLDQLRAGYPDGTPWDSRHRWSSPVLGNGIECAGFAFMVSDKIFGDLPARQVPLEELRTGDVMKNGPENHKNIALNDYGKALDNGVFDPLHYKTADGNVDGKVKWDFDNAYADWPAGDVGTIILTRYPEE